MAGRRAVSDKIMYAKAKGVMHDAGLDLLLETWKPAENDGIMVYNAENGGTITENQRKITETDRKITENDTKLHIYLSAENDGILVYPIRIILTYVCMDNQHRPRSCMPH